MDCNELIKGILVVNAGVAGVGTAVPINTLFAAGAVKLFNDISVTNDADRPVKVEWTNDATGESNFFIVANGGKTFTHRLNRGNITTATLKVYSLSATLATGNIIINLSQH